LLSTSEPSIFSPDHTLPSQASVQFLGSAGSMLKVYGFTATSLMILNNYFRCSVFSAPFSLDFTTSIMIRIFLVN
jgi:hypothetical protein